MPNEIDTTIRPADDPADPKRCQSVHTVEGQCNNLAVPGSTYCRIHGGTNAVRKAEKTALRNYQLDRFHQRVEAMSNSNDVKSLRDEIGILRMLLETRLNQCGDAIELMTAGPVISDMVAKIERLVVSCHKLEDHMGQHLDKQVLLSFAQQIVHLISAAVEPEVADKLADGIIGLLHDQVSDEQAT